MEEGTERYGQNVCTYHDTREGLSSRQRCWRWTDLNLKLNSPCAEQQGQGSLLTLRPSYLGRRGNLPHTLMGWFYTPSLYMASVKERGGGSGAVSLPKMPFLPSHVEHIWKHIYESTLYFLQGRNPSFPRDNLSPDTRFLIPLNENSSPYSLLFGSNHGPGIFSVCPQSHPDPFSVPEGADPQKWHLPVSLAFWSLSRLSQ